MATSVNQVPDNLSFDRREARKAVLGGAVGNFVVFYELFTYGYLAVVIGTVFFPTEDPFTAFLAAFVVYALTYVARPVGAFVLGRLADKRGRRPVLLGTMVVMCVATAAIGVLPTYSQVGALAPALLVFLRLVQGFAASGEFGSAVTLMAEFAPENRRGLWTSWQSFTTGVAIVAGSGIATILTNVLTESQLYAWGWRLPFLLAIVFGGVAIYLRSQIDESPVFLRMQQNPTVVSHRFQPLRFAAPTWVLVLFIAGLVVAWTAGGSVFLQVLPAYAESAMGISGGTAQALTLLAAVMFTVTSPLAGLLSDYIGRRNVMMIGAAVIAVLSYPLFLVVGDGSLALALVCMAVAGTAIGMMAGPGPAMISELFPSDVRATAVGLGYNLQEAIFGGLAGLIIGGLQAWTGDPFAAAYYTVIGGIVSVACLSLVRSSHRRALL